MNRNSPAVLVCSAGAKIPLIQALQDASQRTLLKPRIICGDSNREALCRYFADDFWEMKALNLYSDLELKTALNDMNVRLIIPTRDGELNFWSEKRDSLKEVGVHVLVSKQEALEKTMDKLEFSKWLKKMKFPYIETDEHPDSISKDHLVIKERFASAPKNTLINLKKGDASIFSTQHECAIYQEFVEGLEISVDVWVGSKSTSTASRSRDLIVDGEARVTSSFKNSEIEELARRIVTKLDLWGPCVLQFIMRKDGAIFPIECNARLGGASTFSIRTKFDSLYLFLCELFNEEPTNIRILSDKKIQVRALKDYYF